MRRAVVANDETAETGRVDDGLSSLRHVAGHGLQVVGGADRDADHRGAVVAQQRADAASHPDIGGRVRPDSEEVSKDGLVMKSQPLVVAL